MDKTSNLNVIDILEDVKARAKTKRQVVATSVPAAPQDSYLPIQLPIWPNVVRGLPNAFARSALFTVGNRNKARLNCKSLVIASVAGARIEYTGEELRQDDEDVFLQILHLSRHQKLSSHIEFSSYAMIKALGWTMNKRSYDRLHETITRLDANSLVVFLEDLSIKFSGSLIRKFVWKGDNGEAGKWRIFLEPEIIYLFGDTTYSLLYWETRLSLSALAKWLHSFYCTHRDPYPYKVETFMTLSGSRQSAISGFRRELKRSLQELVDKRFLDHYEIDKADLIQVKRNVERIRLGN